jgi:aspartate aminotransferase-like enzyme
MESVARQFANDKKCLVIRNGWFSYRWSQIFEYANIPSEEIVLKAKRVSDGDQSPFTPPPIESVIAKIKNQKPYLVFAPHVETASGIILPDEYIKEVSDAVHAQGGMLVLDCIASGAVWVDMNELGVDVLISAPQKGWSGSPGFGMVMLSERALVDLTNTNSTSFACDLNKWLQIMQAYEGGGHAYHATMPTDTIHSFRNTIYETSKFGFDKAKEKQQELGIKIRSLLESNGINSVSAKGFQAPGVVVSYTKDTGIHNGSKFMDIGVQIAAGVPLQCDEGESFKTFRLGLFGLDKLMDVDGAVSRFSAALKLVT